MSHKQCIDCASCGAVEWLFDPPPANYKEGRRTFREHGWRQVLDYHFRRFVWLCPACVAKRKETKG